MARKHHQYNVAKSCTELEGKYLAMFTDNLNQSGQGLSINVSLDEEETPEERRAEIAERNVG